MDRRGDQDSTRSSILVPLFVILLLLIVLLFALRGLLGKLF
jgi:hypothetical protein